MNNILKENVKIINNNEGSNAAYQMRQGKYTRMSEYSKNRKVSNFICEKSYDGYIAFPSSSYGLMQEIMLCSPSNKIERQQLNGYVNVNVNRLSKIIWNNKVVKPFPKSSYNSPPLKRQYNFKVTQNQNSGIKKRSLAKRLF